MPVSLKEKIGFHRKHDRKKTQYTGELTNPVTGEVTKPPSRTKRAHLAECDINNILKQFRATGQITHMRANAARGMYTELPDPIEFQEALNVVLESERSFASLPSQVRSRFHNDPQEFLEFMSDPVNQDEAIKLGLAVDKRQPQAQAAGGGLKPPEKPSTETPAPAATPPQPKA